MEGPLEHNGYKVGVLVISDTVSVGEKKDSSGVSIVNILDSEKIFRISSIEQHCVADSKDDIENILKLWADIKNIDLILTVGGTGFSPRDITPEATRHVIDREAPHLAMYMIMGCCQKTPFAALSRCLCGMRGRSLILNLPGSVKGATECFEMVAPLLAHAMDQLKGNKESVAALHAAIQTSDKKL